MSPLKPEETKPPLRSRIPYRLYKSAQLGCEA